MPVCGGGEIDRDRERGSSRTTHAHNLAVAVTTRHALAMTPIPTVWHCVMWCVGSGFSVLVLVVGGPLVSELVGAL